MLLTTDLVVGEGEEAVVVQQHVDQVGELSLAARGEEAVTDHVDNLHMLRYSTVQYSTEYSTVQVTDYVDNLHMLYLDRSIHSLFHVSIEIRNSNEHSQSFKLNNHKEGPK